MSHYTITSGAVPTDARVVGFRGFEALSTPFEFEVFVNVAGDGADLEDGVGANAVLHMRPPSGDLTDPLALIPHDYAGVLWETEVIRVVSGRAVARLVLVPRIALLRNSFHSRVWHKRSIKQIFQELLEGYGLAQGSDFTIDVADSPTEEHVCQYEESDLDFMHRWIEREGWYYYFDHRGEKDKLVIRDAVDAEDVRGAAVRYIPSGDRRGYSKQAFAHFSYSAAARPKSVKLLDHDYAKPTAQVSAEGTVEGGAQAAVVRWGNRSFTNDDSSRIATRRAELLANKARQHVARGAVSHLTSGFGFALSEHPRTALNEHYLVVAARHFGREATEASDIPELDRIGQDVYLVEVDCQPAASPYRTPLRTPWPIVTGFQNGVVDGAAGPYSPIDDMGRYNVRFHFDENRAPTGGASTRMRMAQPHGGPNEGLHFPLRASTEVLCGFLGGDPDCPIVVGVTPNAAKPSPVVEANLSQNVIQTGSGNYMTVEDQAGAEFMNLYSPANQSGLYLGTGRGDGGRGFTANAAPGVPPEGPGGLECGPFSFDLRSDAGHGQLHAGVDLNVCAGGDFQLIARGHSNVTYQAHLDFDALACVMEDYHAELAVCVESSTDIDYEDQLDSCVTGDATEFYRDTVCVDVTLLTTQDFLSTLDTIVIGAPWETTCMPPYNVKVASDATDNVFGHEKVTVASNELVEIDGNLIETIASGNYDLTADTFETYEGQLFFHNISSLTNSEVTAVANNKYTGIKVDVVIGAHLEVWPNHNEDLFAINASATGVKAEATGIKMTVGFCLDIETDLTEAEATGVEYKLALVNAQVCNAGSLKTGAARIGTSLLNIFM